VPRPINARVIRWAMAAVLVAGTLLGGVYSWWRGRPERHLARAAEALSDGDPSGAMGWLDLPESLPTTRDRALILRAWLSVERGDLAGSARALDRVDPDGPAAADLAYWKGRTLYSARRTLPAIAWFRTALERRPAFADASRWLAVAAYDIGDRATALAALESVTRLEPDDARAWRTLGLIFKENVDFEQARTALENSLASDGDQPGVRLDLAEVLLKLGDAAEADRQLALCAGGAPEAARAALLRSESCKLRDDLPGQRLAVEAGLATAPEHPGLLTQLALIEIHDGRPDDALLRLDRAVAADPFASEAIYQRGTVLRVLGRSDEARRDFDRAAELKKGLETMSKLNDEAANAPHDADVRYRLGRICVDLGKPELAASWYRASLACNPAHAEARFALNALRTAPAPRR
jgi:tetratricopeptide (TPR) repeat protein